MRVDYTYAKFGENEYRNYLDKIKSGPLTGASKYNWENMRRYDAVANCRTTDL